MENEFEDRGLNFTDEKTPKDTKRHGEEKTRKDMKRYGKTRKDTNTTFIKCEKTGHILTTDCSN